MPMFENFWIDNKGLKQSFFYEVLIFLAHPVLMREMEEIHSSTE